MLFLSQRLLFKSYDYCFGSFSYYCVVRVSLIKLVAYQMFRVKLIIHLYLRTILKMTPHGSKRLPRIEVIRVHTMLLHGQHMHSMQQRLLVAHVQLYLACTTCVTVNTQHKRVFSVVFWCQHVFLCQHVCVVSNACTSHIQHAIRAVIGKVSSML